MEIDLVYLWVDGNDPQWQAKHNAVTGKQDVSSSTDGKGRYADNDELKYSLRSIEKYAPWVRRIFIVTDNQCPKWLDTTNAKVQIIDHTQILPTEALPCFNSSVIEYFLYKIPDLTEHFLLANDDVFFNAPLQPSFFFAQDGFPIVRLKKHLFEKQIYSLRRFIGKRSGQYRHMIASSVDLVKNKFGKDYGAWLPHHNIDACVKSDYRQAIESVFEEQVEKSLSSHTRQFGDFHRSACSYYALAIGHGHLKQAGNHESKRISAHKPDFMKILHRCRPALFCLNDSQRVGDDDRARIKPFLEKLFPEKSKFEK